MKITADTFKIGDKVWVRANHVNGGVATKGVVIAIDNPGREFGVKIDRRYYTFFNTEISFH